MQSGKYNKEWMIISLLLAGIGLFTSSLSCTKKEKKVIVKPEKPVLWVGKEHKGTERFIFYTDSDMSLRQLSKLTGKSEQDLIRWNEELKKRAPYKGQGIALWLTPKEEKLISTRIEIHKLRNAAYPNVKEIIDYTVKGGETIPRLVRRFHSDAILLKQMNCPSKLVVMAPGTKLKIPVLRRKSMRKRPSISGTVIYKVCNGDSAWRIAHKYRISLKKLREFNPDIDINRLRVGEYLRIPVTKH